MSAETHSDPRVTLVREKYFGLRPKPLERWFWDAKAPGSAERVYWYHWDIGHQNGTWISQVPIRIVAQECALDVATVTRAYQWLKGRGVLRRVDAGRDDANPFRQATSLTEVYVPRDLVQRLSASPNRRGRTPSQRPVTDGPAMAGVGPAPQAASAAPSAVSTADSAKAYSRRESQQIFRKLSDAERGRFYAAQKNRESSMAFEAGSALDADEQTHINATLSLLAKPSKGGAAAAGADPKPSSSAVGSGRAGSARAPKTLSLMQIVALRSRLKRAKGEGDERDVDTLTREIAWSLEQGSLARFEHQHAVAIACKKVREGQWSTPFGMPAGWNVRSAGAELCVSAGGY